MGGLSMGYRIGSFNCLSFGMAATKDINTFVDIISQENFDIIALQEMHGPNALKRILNRLNPNKWQGQAAYEGSRNDYAFIWNKKRIALAKTRNGNNPYIYKNYSVDRKAGQEDLLRDPYFARFIPIGGGAPRIEIRIINAHIRYSKGKPDDSSDENSPGAIQKRKNEFDILTKSIYAKEADNRYGNNRPSYTILLGDYNLNKEESNLGSPYLPVIPIEVVDGKRRKIIVTEQIKASTLKRPKDFDDPEQYGYANNFDHFTYDEIRFSTITKTCDVIDAYCERDFKKYRQEVSDHLPIVLDIEFKE